MFYGGFSTLNSMTQSNTFSSITHFELFLFDMDGTLVNTEPLHAKAMDMVFRKYGIEVSMGEEEALEKFKGMTDSLVLKALCPDLSDEKREAMIAEKNQQLKMIFKELKENDILTLTTPGLKELLQFIKSHGKKLAVVSASENEVVHDTLTAFGLLQEFDFWFGRGSTARTKPHPDPYIEAMKKAGVDKAQTVIFEDSPTGLNSARSSGATVIEVAPFGKEDYLKDYRYLLPRN